MQLLKCPVACYNVENRVVKKIEKGYTLSISLKNKLVHSRTKKRRIAMSNSIKIKTQETKKVKFVNPEPTLIGTVDIGKNTLFGYLQGPQGQEVKPFEFSNNINGLTKFWHKTIIANKKYGTSKIIMGFESTGPYGEPFKNFMLDKKQVEL
ncbi:MAG: hypothetical protein QME81_20020, partial [bacterium]|nr:hypothetical protein [bacterium]